jgi:predicted ABC-type transport system involved in lysophospholipase L1 biosynthesis ATPase subunit
MSEPILTARGLRKGYLSGDRRIEVLQGIDFEIAARETVSIRGESGSGKSTLLHLLAGLDSPDQGTVTWAGLGGTGSGPRGRFLGMVFQAFYLIPELTARENVLMARRILGPVDRAAAARADELLAQVGLTPRADHLPAQLSGGERQRVALARALVNAPRLVLADEPTGNLDEATGDAMIELLLRLCADTGTALVLVTHNPAYAARAARPLVLHGGRLQ